MEPYMRIHLCTPPLGRPQSAMAPSPPSYHAQDDSHAVHRAPRTDDRHPAKYLPGLPPRTAILLTPIHPLQAILLAGALPLFLGVLFCDLAYARSLEVQWKNFASWLLVGGLTLSSGALIWALVDFVRLSGLSRLSRDRIARAAYLAMLLVICILGFVNALVHAGDAWASMPAGLVLAAVIALLAVAAVWLGFSSYRGKVGAA